MFKINVQCFNNIKITSKFPIFIAHSSCRFPESRARREKMTGSSALIDGDDVSGASGGGGKDVCSGDAGSIQ